MECPAGTTEVPGLTVAGLDRFSYGYHIIVAVALLADIVGIVVYACVKRSLDTAAGRGQRRGGIWVRIALFVVLSLVLLFYALFASGAGPGYAVGDAFTGPVVLMSVMLLLHSAAEAGMVYGRHARRYAPDATSAMSDLITAYVGLTYATRAPVVDDPPGRQAVALWVGFMFVLYGLLALAYALPEFRRPYAAAGDLLGLVKSSTLLAAGILMLAARDPSPLDPVHPDPDTVCSRPYSARPEFALHVGLLILTVLQTGLSLINAATGCMYSDTPFAGPNKGGTLEEVVAPPVRRTGPLVF